MKFSRFGTIAAGCFLALGSLLLTGAFVHPLWAQPLELVADLMPGLPGTEGSPNREGYWSFGDRSVYESETGYWITDGTPAGTYSLGRTCSTCSTVPSFVGTTQRRAYWNQRAPGGEFGLWSTDGTPRGAAPVDESILLRSGLEASNFLFSGEAVYFGGFQDPAFGIWRYHPEEGPPQRLVTGFDSLSFGTLSEFAELDGEVYFVAYGEGPGPGLFRTDGTASGTRQLVSFGSNVQADPRGLTRLGDLLFFIADEGNGEDLWVSDGTSSGTRRLTSIRDFGAFAFRAWIRPWSGGAFFLAPQENETRGIWTSDGTPQGTRPITAFPSSASIADERGAEAFAAAEDFILFGARESRDDPYVLWRADAGSAEPSPVFGPGEGPVLEDRELGFLTAGGRFFFPALREAGRESLWMTDGTADGTVPIESLCGAACGGIVQGLTEIDGVVLFLASGHAGGGQSFWRTDGTAEGTWQLAEEGIVEGSDSAMDSGWIGRVAGGYVLRLRAPSFGSTFAKLAEDGEVSLIRSSRDGDFGSLPREFEEWGSELAFIAMKPSNSFPDDVVWTVHPETLEVRELLPNPPWGSFEEPEELVSTAEHLFIRLNRDGDLWSTDGTSEGTVRLWEGDFNRSSYFQVAAGGDLIFGVKGFESQCEIWRSDGSLGGTRRILQLGNQFCFFGNATKVDGDLYFLMGINGAEEEVSVLRFRPETEEVQVLARFPGDSRIPDFRSGPHFTGFEGAVYFLLEGTLWRFEDGSQEATPLAEVGSVPAFTPMRELGGQLYFLGKRFRELVLWQTDGTASGTSPVRTWELPFFQVELSEQLEVVADRLWFQAYETATGTELWSSDGTEAGTALAGDLEPGSGHSHPRNLQMAEGQLFFTAEDRFRGRELWTLDGLELRLVQDLHPGPFGGMWEELAGFQGSLWLTGTEGLRGFELWRLPLSEPETGCQPGAERLCLQGGRFSVEASWVDFQGQTGNGQAVSLTEDTGYFWFFNEENVEAILKVLDGRPSNDHFWSFYGALSNVEYHLTVRDTETGAARRYFNPLRSFASVGDTRSFGPQGAGSLGNLNADHHTETLEGASAREPIITQSFDASAVGQPCAPTSTRLCLQDGRFAVEASWADFQGNTGVGQAVELTQDTGYFWFFRDTNVEAVLKVLDGRSNNGKFWVFYGALSNVDYDLTVTDCETGAVKTYQNRDRTFASVGDTEAFGGS